MAFTDNLKSYIDHLSIGEDKVPSYRSKTISTDISLKRKMTTISAFTEITPQVNHVPILFYMQDTDKFVDIRQLGGGLKMDKIDKYNSSTTLTTNLTDVGHVEGMPNFLAGGLVIYVPSTYSGDKAAILAKIEKHVALGTNIKIIFN